MCVWERGEHAEGAHCKRLIWLASFFFCVFFLWIHSVRHWAQTNLYPIYIWFSWWKKPPALLPVSILQKISREISRHPVWLEVSCLWWVLLFSPLSGEPCDCGQSNRHPIQWCTQSGYSLWYSSRSLSWVDLDHLGGGTRWACEWFEPWGMWSSWQQLHSETSCSPLSFPSFCRSCCHGTILTNRRSLRDETQDDYIISIFTDFKMTLQLYLAIMQSCMNREYRMGLSTHPWGSSVFRINVEQVELTIHHLRSAHHEVRDPVARSDVSLRCLSFMETLAGLMVLNAKL